MSVAADRVVSRETPFDARAGIFFSCHPLSLPPSPHSLSLSLSLSLSSYG